MGSVTPNSQQDLYQSAAKIYPRAIGGRFVNLRWLTVWITQLVFYGVPWLQWNGRQAVLFDIEARRFHLFGVVLWPQDFILLTGLLVVSALTLFLFTAVAGRLWCGYSCPQTVYTEIFLWVESLWEGDGPQRRRLDQGPWTLNKFIRKAGKQLTWGAMAFWTGLTFVGFFIPIRTVVPDLFAGALPAWPTFWVFFYGFATYGNAGYLREQICKYMCPYARFQGVMMDLDTVTATYDTVRGEPRGSRGKNATGTHLGDCVDCKYCVQVCPTGIDIREGSQIECINCGLCVDACDHMMDKMNYPRGLISYTSLKQLELKHGNAEVIPHPLLRKRVFIYGGLIILIGSLLIFRIATRAPVRLDVMRDRAVMSRETPTGDLENIYRLQVLNMSEVKRHFRISVSGIPGAYLHPDQQAIDLSPLENRWMAVDVDVPESSVPVGVTPFTVTVTADDDPSITATSQTLFFKPN